MTGTNAAPVLPSCAQSDTSPALEDLHLLDLGYPLDQPKALSPAQLLASIFEPAITTRKLNAMRTEYLSRRQQASQTEQLEERQLTETVERAGGLMYFSIDPSRKAGSYFFAESPKNRPLRRIIHLPDDFPVAKKRRVQEDEEIEEEMRQEVEMDTASSRGRSRSPSSAGQELIVSRVATPLDVTPQPPSNNISGVASTSIFDTHPTTDHTPGVKPAQMQAPPPPVARRIPSYPNLPVNTPQPTSTSSNSPRLSSSFPSIRPPGLPSRPSFNYQQPEVPPLPPSPPLFARPKLLQAPYSYGPTRSAYSPPLASPSTVHSPPWSAGRVLAPPVCFVGVSKHGQSLLTSKAMQYPSVQPGSPPLQSSFRPSSAPPIASHHTRASSNPSTRLPNPYAPSSDPYKAAFDPHRPSPSPYHPSATPMSTPALSAAPSHHPSYIPDPPSTIKPLLKLLLEHEANGDFAPLGGALGMELKKNPSRITYREQLDEAEKLGYITKSRVSNSNGSPDEVRLMTGTVRLNGYGEVVGAYQLPQPPSRPPSPPPRPPAAVNPLPSPSTPLPSPSYALPSPPIDLLIFVSAVAHEYTLNQTEIARSQLGEKISKLGGRAHFKEWCRQAQEEGWTYEIIKKHKTKGGEIQFIGLTKKGKEWADSRSYRY